MTRPAKSFPAALTLFFTAPLVAEFLLGDLSLKLLPALIVLAPTYGGAALLIREFVRRSGRGWPSILLLGAAYALLGEGFITQSLFNPDYLRLHLHFLDHGWIPALGIGAWWTLFMLNLHAFWSVGVSIALVEGLFPTRAEGAWLGPIGESVVAILFLLGSLAMRRYTLRTEHFNASHAQAAGTAALCLLLIAVAFLLPRVRASAGELPAPSAWLMGAAALLLGMAVLMIPPVWNWGAAAVMLAIDVCFLLSVGWLSHSHGWTGLHTLSLGAGGALAYGIHAFFQPPLNTGSRALGLAGNAVFLSLALVVIVAGVKRTSSAVRYRVFS